MDKISIQGLQVKSLIGVYDWEREAKQALLIDLELGLSLSPAAKSDNVEDTIDYAALALAVEKLCLDSEFTLLEALADHLIAHLLTYTGVQCVTLSVTKPDILPNAAAVSVTLHREAQ